MESRPSGAIIGTSLELIICFIVSVLILAGSPTKPKSLLLTFTSIIIEFFLLVMPLALQELFSKAFTISLLNSINTSSTTFIISLLIGFVFCYLGRHSYKNISLTDQIIFIVLSYFLIPLLISIPFFFSIYNISLLNSYFESVSGFTTTGFSIFVNVEKIRDHNSQNHTWKMGINNFTDLSKEEYMKTYLKNYV